MNTYHSTLLIVGGIIAAIAIAAAAFVVTWQLQREPPGPARQTPLAVSSPAATPDFSVCDEGGRTFESLEDVLADPGSVCHLQLGEDDPITADIGRFTNLQTLSISQTSLTQLPPEIGNVQGLLILNMPNNPNLHRLPDEITSLKSLKLLNIKGTGIRTLPAEVGNMTGLRQIILDQGQIDPEEAHRLRLLLPRVQLVELDEDYRGGIFFAG